MNGRKIADILQNTVKLPNKRQHLLFRAVAARDKYKYNDKYK